MTFLDRLRYRWISLTKGTAHLGRIKQEAVRQLIGHTRIIGWEGGLPVRSLAIPAEYSQANAAMMARLYNSIRPALQFPGVMSLSITNRCDCECPHCCAAGQDGDELPLDKWCETITHGLELGVFSCVLTGGEPLLRGDLPALIRSIDPDRATCLVYTNGSRLAERAGELYRAGLRRVAIAFDSADEREHDEHRRHMGLYRKAIQGCQEAKRLGMLVGISTFSSPERLDKGVLAGIFDLARRLAVHEIIVYDLLPSGRLCKTAIPGAASADYRKRLRDFIQHWWGRIDAPGVWWYAHVTSFANLGCPGGSTMLNVSHRGEVRPCDFCRTSVGSVFEENLTVLWRRLNALSRQHGAGPRGCMVLE